MFENFLPYENDDAEVGVDSVRHKEGREDQEPGGRGRQNLFHL